MIIINGISEDDWFDLISGFKDFSMFNFFNISWLLDVAKWRDQRMYLRELSFNWRRSGILSKKGLDISSEG